MKQLIAITLLCSLFFIGCDNESTPSPQEQRETMSEVFIIKAGMSPADYNQRNAAYTKKNIDKQPAGLNFYEQNWSIKNQGVVRVDNGDFSFDIMNVLSSTGTEDTELPGQGIYKFSVNSGITADELIDHDKARIQFMKIIQELVVLGWESYQDSYVDPRLSGKESFQYAIKDGRYAPDPTYMPTLEEWMALDSSHSWTVHANHVFLEVSFRRSKHPKAEDNLGVYLLNFKLHMKEAQAMRGFEGDQRQNWQNLWIENIKRSKLLRYKKEVELIKQGYHINTDYNEPKIHPQDPIEPDSQEAKALLDFIQKNNN